MLKIRELNVFKPFLLAPLAGVITIPFRKLIDELGECGIIYTELVSVEALLRKNRKTMELISDSGLKTPLFVQLFGHNPESFRQAIETLSGINQFSGIDINCGCPVKRVIKNNCGAALLDQPELLAKIVATCRRVTNLPLTVKVRLGFRQTDLFKVLQTIEAAGADAITVHFRYQQQSYSQPADWKWAEKLKQAVKIPLIGNGDVVTPEDAQKKLMLVDGVMIGRGAVANPFIFQQIAGKVVSDAERRRILLKLVDRYRQSYSNEKQALGKIKAIFSYLTLENRISRKDKLKIFLACSWSEFTQALDELLQKKFNAQENFRCL